MFFSRPRSEGWPQHGRRPTFLYSYIASPSTGFTLRRGLTAFTRPAITPQKVKRFGWNLEHCEPKFGAGHGRLWARFKQHRQFEREPKFCILVTQITHNFIYFPSDNFHEFCTQQRRSVSRCELSEQNFENFIIRGRFYKKRKKCLENVQISGRRNYAMITDGQKLTAKINL